MMQWVKGKLLRTRTAQSEEPAEPARLVPTELMRRCPICRRPKVAPGGNPGLYAGVCTCDLRDEG